MYRELLYKTKARIQVIFNSKKIFQHLLSKAKIKNTNKDIYAFYKKIFSKVNEKTTINLQGIGKVYEGGFKAIHNYNLTINKGEFVSLLGPSGCGKTTILRMVAGLELISEGTILMNDVIMNSALPKERNLSMVFQNYALYPYMNVYQNIAFGLKNKTYENNLADKLLNELISIINPNYVDIKYLLLKIKNERKINSNKIKILKTSLRKEKRIGDKEKIKSIKIEIKSLVDQQNNYFLKIGKSNIENINKEISKIKSQSKKVSINKKDIKEKIISKYNEYLNSLVIWKESIPARIHHFSSLVGIENYLKRKPAALSGGQRQRVALVRAISKDAGLFLFDEPLSNLDAKLRGTMRSEIRKLHDDLKSSSIFVTHDQVEAMSMSDKIVLMNKGYIQQVGSPSELFNKSSNIFVADFIGNPGINFVKGKVKNSTTIIVKNKEIKISKRNQEISQKIENYKGKQIILGIRPQNVITDNILVNQNNENVLEVKVESIETVGHENILVVSSPLFESVFKIVAVRYIWPKKGEKIKIKINPNTVQAFDVDTGESITTIPNKETAEALKIWYESSEERIKNLLVAQKEKTKEKFSHKIAKDLYGVVNSKYGKIRQKQKKLIKNKKFKEVSLVEQVKNKGGN